MFHLPTSLRFAPFWCAGLALLVLLVDYFTGPAFLFPILYLMPVMLAAWYSSLSLALVLAVLMPLIRVFFEFLWDIHYLELHVVINTVNRIIILVLLAVLTERVARQMRQLAREVEQLTGLLPICAFCKKIRTKGGEWVQIERYISDRSSAEFSHGYCPECMEKHFGEYLRDRKQKEK
jgi:K+-sensing histidine kinase KdpD